MRHLMYTELKIISTLNSKIRSYVIFYFNGKRIREYNGKKLNLPINPNYASSIKDRDKLLNRLKFEIQKALDSGWDPTLVPVTKKGDVEKTTSTNELLKGILQDKLNSSLSDSYKRDLNSVCKQFLEFLTLEERDGSISKLPHHRVSDFLQQFNTSGTFYMNKRRNLGVVFGEAVKKGFLTLNPIKDTSKRKSKATLHQIYTDEQLKEVLEFLKRHYPNLHLCCLLSFGCFLRPHQEIRNLFGHHFKNDFSEIHLSGDENKGGKVRVVYIPEYVKRELAGRIPLLKPDINLFTLTSEPFNVCYFNLQWSRAKKKMGTLDEKQTIYSFRHTAAIRVYNKTKDIYILQQLLAHSNMIVTLKYLRGLGQLNGEKLKEAIPHLY